MSQQIRQLEDELRLPLFDRIAKRVRLTEAGKAFLPYALKTLKDAEDGKETLRDLMELKTGVLSIGVTYGLTDLPLILPSVLAERCIQEKIRYGAGGLGAQLWGGLRGGSGMKSFQDHNRNGHTPTREILRISFSTLDKNFDRDFNVSISLWEDK